jgi:hypothetical protein
MNRRLRGLKRINKNESEATNLNNEKHLCFIRAKSVAEKYLKNSLAGGCE